MQHESKIRKLWNLSVFPCFRPFSFFLCYVYVFMVPVIRLTYTLMMVTILRFCVSLALLIGVASCDSVRCRSLPQLEFSGLAKCTRSAAFCWAAGPGPIAVSASIRIGVAECDVTPISSSGISRQQGQSVVAEFIVADRYSVRHGRNLRSTIRAGRCQYFEARTTSDGILHIAK